MKVWAAVLLGLSVAGMAGLAHLRDSWSIVTGDESTFIAMTESVAFDRDLIFDESDLARIEAAAEPSSRTVILQRVEEKISYSKPALYPVVAAPLFRLFGRGGLSVFNILALLAGVAIFWWSTVESRGTSDWPLALATFLGTGAVLPYVAWSTGDALQLSLALAGASLCIGKTSSRSALLGGLALGLLIVMRLPNGLLAAGVVTGVALVARRRAGIAALGVASGLALGLLLNFALGGTINPYRAERATFNSQTGYPAGEQGEVAAEQFVTGRATQRLAAKPRFAPVETGYSALYFLVGRHSGLVFYFPLALVLFGTALTGLNRVRALGLLAVLELVGFYLVWMPENYFGGASFIGNRYFLPAYGVLLATLIRPPRARWLAVVWILSLGVWASAVVSVIGERSKPYSSQSHAFKGLPRLLPYESTALAIENRQDRYYSDEFLRFVDRNARVGEHGVRLKPGAVTEVLLATARPSGILRFLVSVNAPGARLVYRDWKGKQEFDLEDRPGGSGGLVELVAAPAWRRHGFWFADGTWFAHSVRLSIEAPRGSVGDIRYVGPYRLVPKFFAYRAAGFRAPEQAAAGSRGKATIRLKNQGLRPWASEADIPIHLMHRLLSVDGEVVASGLTPIDELVEPRGEIRLRANVDFPDEAGRYELELDLVAGGVAPFASWMDGPAAVASVEVVAEPVETAPVVSSSQ